MDIYIYPEGIPGTLLEFQKLTFLTFVHILLIVLASCYLHISLTDQKIFADFWCNLRWFSTRMRKMTFWITYFFNNMIYFKRRSEYLLRVYIHPSKLHFHQSVPFSLKDIWFPALAIPVAWMNTMVPKCGETFNLCIQHRIYTFSVPVGYINKTISNRITILH